MHKIGTLFNEDFYIESANEDALGYAREYFKANKEDVDQIAGIVLLKYFEWCQRNGIAKNTVLLFARESGILIE